MALNPEAKKKVWLQVRNENCTLCPLHKSAQNVCLLGDGPVPSKIMLVGEAPGAREDDIARPFSGPAGKYLDRILEEVGLPRSGLYITNSVRCRPPDNATPTNGQIKACSGYMRDEIDIVQPEYLLLLGNAALKAILNTSGVMKKRGTAQQMSDGRTAFITVHPAAVLRNPGLETSFKSDLMSFARLVRGEDSHPETQSKIVTSSKGLARLCQMMAGVQTPIAFDVETGSSDVTEKEGGLNPWSPNGMIHTCSFTWEPGKSYVVSLEHPATKWDIPIKRVYEALNIALQGKKMVGHNVKFDCAWMKAKGVNLYAHFDTRIAAHLLDENQPGGLKALSRTYLGADEYEAGINFGRSVTPLIKLAIYNGKDTDYTLRLYHLFRDELKKQPRLARLFTRLSMPAVRAFIDIESHGFPVDMERLERRHRSILHKIDKVEQEMIEMVPEHIRDFANFRSPQFLGRWFFNELRLPIVMTTPKGAPSTAESALLQLVDKHPAVAKLMELRKWQKNESTYTRNWLERIRVASKPRLYTSYNISGTVTGRLSSNMQQVPRDVYIRSIIGVEPGRKFIEADFSQIELRLAAMFSRDAVLTKAFLNEEDPHLQTAQKILRKAPELITKEERKMAKAVNFGFLYGMGWRKFGVYAKEKYQTEVTDHEAKEYRKAFFAQYRALPIWHERQRRIVRNVGAVSSPMGRIRHLPSINSVEEGVQAEAEREAINSPVQGMASDLTVLSMVRLHRLLDPNRAWILGNVHDSILLEANEDYAEEAAALTKKVMEHLPLKKLFGVKMTIPIKADVTIGTHWGEHE